jgi:4-diphosphocytidyl-2-C-methyl-D-erythritol kinase
VKELAAPAKLNLALVVGPKLPNGKHRVTTVLERISLADTIRVEPARATVVEGFADDTLVHAALGTLAAEAGVAPGWVAEIEKRIPVAAGLGGGSSDAAAALRLANETLPEPLDAPRLHALATRLGADVPFFLTTGSQVAEADGTELRACELRRDYAVLIVLPQGERKPSTAAVYDDFDRRGGARGYEERRAELLDALDRGDVAAFPRNDLASSPLAAELRSLGAFRADVSGAGPAVYGLFEDAATARSAATAVGSRGRTWVERPAW